MDSPYSAMNSLLSWFGVTPKCLPKLFSVGVSRPRESRSAPVALANSYTCADKVLFESGRNQTYESVVKQTGGLSDVVFTKSILKDPTNQIAGFIGTVRLLQQPVDLTASVKGNLSQRETEVLNLLMTGEAVKRIASNLGISRYTVSDHLKSIYRKLDVHSKSEALYKVLGQNHLPFEDNRKWA